MKPVWICGVASVAIMSLAALAQPAWGGATKLPRLIGLPAALDIILNGKTLDGKSAVWRFERGSHGQLS